MEIARPVTALTDFGPWDPRRICGEQSGAGRVLSHCTTVFSVSCLSSSASYSYWYL